MDEKGIYLRRFVVVDASFVSLVAANMFASTYQYCMYIEEMRFDGCMDAGEDSIMEKLVCCQRPARFQTAQCRICEEDARIFTIQKRTHAHAPCWWY